MRPSVPDVHITDSQDAEFAAYRPLAVQGVVGFLFGLLSPLALVNTAFWLLPVIGLSLSWWALRRIHRGEAATTGRRLARIGLVLSLLFLVAAPTDWLVYRRMVRNEARQFCTLWFGYLAAGKPQKALQLTVPPQMRQPLGENLWAYYRNEARARMGLENYVQSPLVRTLLALGSSRAMVRFYETTGQSQLGNDDVVDSVFAVTYEDEGEKRSFFVSLKAARMKLADGSADWRLLTTDGGVKPKGWESRGTMSLAP
jgi:hypothetical protein